MRDRNNHIFCIIRRKQGRSRSSGKLAKIFRTPQLHNNGLQGVAGVAGEQGQPGLIGATGSKGVRGEAGLRGESGMMGPV